MVGIRRIGVFLFAVVLSPQAVGASDPGLAWLTSKGQPTGEISSPSDVSTAVQSSAETVRAFAALNATATVGYAEAVAYLAGFSGYESTETLSRRIVALTTAGQPSATLVNRLSELQNMDGGFGETLGYESTVLDTAFALEAMAYAKYSNTTSISRAIGYLKSRQKSDGSFGLYSTEQSSVYVASTASIALQRFLFQFDVAPAINAANAFLKAQRNASAVWNSDWETAAALLAIIPATTATQDHVQAVEWLRARQGADGSWNGDVFGTALALRALGVADTGAPLPPEPTMASVSGRVLDSSSGLPLAGVAVLGVPPLSGTAVVTGADGAFVAAGVTPGTYAVMFSRSGYMDSTGTLDVTAGQVASMGTIELVPLAQSGTIFGTVVVAATGQPVAGASVTATGSTTVSVLTDASGAYEISLLPGTYSLAVSDGGYLPVTASASVLAGSRLRFDPALSTTVASGPVRFTGTVVDLDTGFPLQDVLITLLGAQTAFTDAAGNFSIDGLAAGEYTANVSLAGYRGAVLNMVAQPGAVINAGMIRLQKVAQLNGSIVQGVVKDAATGAPIPGAVVQLSSNESAISGPDGAYRIEGIAGLQFTATVSVVGYNGSQANIVLAEPSLVSLDFPLVSAGAANFSISRIETDGAASYAAYTTIDLVASLSNTGTEQRAARLFIRVVDQTGTVIESKPAIQLPMGASQEDAFVFVAAGQESGEALKWDTSNYPAGTYSLGIQAYDAYSGQLLAERAVPLTIEPTRRVGGGIAFDPPILQVGSKQPVHLTANLMNRGNLAIDSGTVTATVRLKNAGYREPSFFESKVVAQGNGTRGVIADAQGNAYVANSTAGNVLRIARDGTSSVFMSGLSSPVDVAFDASGNFYVLSSSQNYVRRAVDGTLSTVATKLSGQVAITVAQDGTVFVATVNEIYEVRDGGVPTRILSQGLSSPKDATVNSQGELLVASYGTNSIVKFANGRLSVFASGIPQPHGITVDASDNAFVTSWTSGKVFKVTVDGAVSEVATGLAAPYDVASLSNGSLLVTSNNDSGIHEIDGAGNKTARVTKSVHKPAAMAHDGAGNLYVANTSSAEVTRFGLNGQVNRVGSVSSPVDMASSTDGVFILNTSAVYSASESGVQEIGKISGGAAILASADGVLVGKNTGEYVRLQSGVASSLAVPQFMSPSAVRLSSDGDVHVLTTDGYLTVLKPDWSTSTIKLPSANYFGLAATAGGVRFVSDYSGRKILQVSADGSVSVLTTLAFYPSELAADSQGNLYISEYSSGKVYVRNSAGAISLFHTFPTPIYTGDMLVDADGNLWTLSYNYGRVNRRNADGTTSSITGIYSGYALSEDVSGAILVSSYSQIKKIDPANNAVSIYLSDAKNSTINGIVQLNDGRLWVIGANGVVSEFVGGQLASRRVSLAKAKAMVTRGNGTAIAFDNGILAAVEDFHKLPILVSNVSARDLASDASGNLYVASSSGVTRIDAQTSASTSIIQGYTSISALGVNSAGELVIADETRNSITHHNLSGAKLRTHIGLINPRGVLVNKGRIIVSNSYPNELFLLNGNDLAPFSSVADVTFLENTPDGGMLASRAYSSGYVAWINSNGSLKSTVSAAGTLRGIASVGGAFVVVREDLHALQAVSSSGLGDVLASGIGQIGDLHVTEQGLVAADSKAGVLARINADGSTTVAHSALPSVSGFSFDANGKLLVAYGTNRLVSIDSDGRRTQYPSDKVMGSNAFKGVVWTGNDSVIGSLSNNTIILATGLADATPMPVGGIAYTAQANFTGPFESAKLDFGEWLPENSGDYETVLSFDAGVAGEVANTLHVGANATGILTLAHSRVSPGDRMEEASLQIYGGDTMSLTRIDTDATSLAAVSGAHGRGVVADTAGNIYASDYNRVVKITTDGVVSTFVTGITFSNAMAIDNENNIYGVSGGDIWQVTPTQQKARVVQKQGASYAAVAILGDVLYAVTTSQLHKIQLPSLERQIIPLSVTGIVHVTVNPSGTAYVLNSSNQIYRVSEDGAAALYFDKAQFEYEGVNVTADCSNNLLFAPTYLPGIKTGGEEDRIVQLFGATGEYRQVLYGPTFDSAMSDMDVLYYDRFGQRLLIWTDVANGKIFSFPVICGGINADVHLVARSDVALSSADPAPATAVDLGNGLTEYVWSLTDIDNRGMPVKLNLAFQGLGEGETRAVAQDAFIEFGNTFVPGEKVRVPVSIPSLLASSVVTLDGALAKAEYGPGETVDVSVSVENGNDQPFNGKVEVSVIDRASALVATVPEIPLMDLAGFSPATFAANWSSGTTYMGDYQVHLVLRRFDGHEVAAKDLPFRVTAGAASTTLNSVIAADKSVYEPWGPVKLTARVKNTATNAIQGPTVALVSVVRADGSVVYSGTSAVGELYPNSYTESVHMPWLADETAGTLTALLTVSGSDGLPLTSSATTFSVERMPTSGVRGFVDVAQPQLYRGDANVCTETVTNFGKAELNNVTVRHQLVAMDTGEVLDEKTSLRNLPGNSTQVDTWSVATQEVAIGEYGCVLSVQVAGENKNLDVGGFMVKEPPIRIGAGWQVEQKGRLLVLLDKATNDDECPHDHHRPLGLRAHHGMAVDADTKAEVQWLDEKGRVLASTSLPESASRGKEEDSEGITILSLDENGLTVRLSEDEPECRHCVLNATVVSHGNTRRLSTGPMDRGCSHRHHGVHDVVGDFGVVDVDQTAANDADESRSAPTAAQQHAFMEALLQREGWHYTLVTDAKAFADEFHHGGYAAYLLLSEHVKLSEKIQDELIEAVNRGEGLLIAGAHDERIGRLDEALGIRSRGKHAHVQGLTLVGSDWTEPAEAAFGLNAKPNRITLAGAKPIGRYISSDRGNDDEGAQSHDDGRTDGRDRDHEDHHGDDRSSDDTVAVTEQTYGRGRALYAGFDMLAEATAGGETGLFADLLNRAAARAHPDQVPMASGVAIPLVLTLENQGMAVSGRVLVSLPAGTELVSAAGAIQKADGTIEWNYELGVGQRSQLHVLAIFPVEASVVTAAVQVTSGASYADYTTVEHALVLEANPTLDSAINTAKGLASSKKGIDYRKTAHELEHASAELNRGRVEKAVDNIVDAAKPLKGESATEAVELRFIIDSLLRETARELP